MLITFQINRKARLGLTHQMGTDSKMLVKNIDFTLREGLTTDTTL
jgi:hypothetical protein